MKKLLFSIVFLLSASILFSETIISNGQTVSGKWTVKGSPYIIEGEAIVPAGKTLVIKPGVVVRFKAGKNFDYTYKSTFDVAFLRVNGKIIAKGKEENPIIFSRVGNIGNWGVVYIDSRNKRIIFKYCRFMFSMYVKGIITNNNATAALSFHNATGKIKNCVFVENTWTAINCKNQSNPDIINCTIVKNKYGLESNSNSTPKVLNTIFYGNETTFYTNGNARPMISHCFVDIDDLPKDVKDGGGNILSTSSEPKFVNEFDRDFHLKPDSPLLKKGKEGVNIGSY